MLFDEVDVIKIATAITKTFVYYASNSRDTCNFCDHDIWSGESSVSRGDHEIDCPVIVAKDILVGHERSNFA